SRNTSLHYWIASLTNSSPHFIRLEIALAKAEARQVEVEETLSAQVTFLSQNYKAAFDDIKKLSTANADLMGHQNAQQKIHHIAKLKEELVKLKQENASITRERDALKRRNLIIERDLEAFKAVMHQSWAPLSLMRSQCQEDQRRCLELEELFWQLVRNNKILKRWEPNLSLS
ncbi:hypothetical protein BC830DRAFT_1086657, partial [Chytriomyces sp. MP71]